MATPLVTSTLLMGAIVLAVAILIMRLRAWKPTPTPQGGGDGGAGFSGAVADGLVKLARDPMGWTIAFILTILLFGGATLVFAGLVSIPPALQGTLTLAIGALFVLMFTIYIFAGTYLAARSRGLASSMAAAVGSWVIGLLFLAALGVKLILEGG
ncbi:MAG: hypothetical protein ABEH65_00460 [Halobacteriales archaeon]